VAQSVFQSGQDIFMTQTVVITGASAGGLLIRALTK
jgi:protease II